MSGLVDEYRLKTANMLIELDGTGCTGLTRVVCSWRWRQWFVGRDGGAGCHETAAVVNVGSRNENVIVDWG